MRTLPKPLQNKKVKDIFTECVNSFKHESARNSKMSYVVEVENCSNAYDEYIPSDIEHFEHPNLNSESKEDLEKIYKEKFSREGTVGRKYYDIIMAQAEGVCPICCAGTPTNLDHYLPQSKYVLLVVTPVNLIPSCRDCNMGKSSYDTKKSSKMPLHPYYDRIELQWLEAKITFMEDGTFDVKFYNGISGANNPVEKERIDIHIKVHGLNENFSSKASTEIHSIKGRYKDMVKKSSKDDVEKDIKSICESAEVYDVNSWKSALYRALVRQVDGYIEWLNYI